MPLKRQVSFRVVDELIVVSIHFNYFLILNNHVIKRFKYHPMGASGTTYRGICVQLALMSRESLTLQVSNKHNFLSSSSHSELEIR